MNRFFALIALALLYACAQQPGPAPESISTPSTGQVPAPAATVTPDEGAAAAALKEIHQAQTDFFGRNRRYALDYDELIESHFLREEPAVARTGYEIRMRPSADAASYAVSAIPAGPSTTARHLFMDKSGAIHAEQGKDANVESPEI